MIILRLNIWHTKRIELLDTSCNQKDSHSQPCKSLLDSALMRHMMPLQITQLKEPFGMMHVDLQNGSETTSEILLNQLLNKDYKALHPWLMTKST